MSMQKPNGKVAISFYFVKELVEITAYVCPLFTKTASEISKSIYPEDYHHLVSRQHSHFLQ